MVPGTMCDSIDEESGDTLVDELYCGDTVYYVGTPPLVLTPGLFMWYNSDVRTDADGGLHLLPKPILLYATTLYMQPVTVAMIMMVMVWQILQSNGLTAQVGTIIFIIQIQLMTPQIGLWMF